MSQKSNAGGRSSLSAYSIVTIYASVELWLTASCPFDAAAIGVNMFGPANTKNSPVVDLEAMALQAKSESAKSNRRQSDMDSPRGWPS